MNLRFNRPQNPSEVHFVLTKDGEDAVRYAMNLVKDEDNEFTYSLTITYGIRGPNYFFTRFNFQMPFA